MRVHTVRHVTLANSWNPRVPSRRKRPLMSYGLSQLMQPRLILRRHRSLVVFSSPFPLAHPRRECRRVTYADPRVGLEFSILILRVPARRTRGKSTGQTHSSVRLPPKSALPNQLPIDADSGIGQIAESRLLQTVSRLSHSQHHRELKP